MKPTPKHHSALDHFLQTGEIPDDLLPFFSQQGEFDPEPFAVDESPGFFDAIKDIIVPSDRISRTEPDGTTILLTSLLEDINTEEMDISYHEIHGSVFCPNQKKIDAPNLTSIGGNADFCSATELNVPKLKTVGGYLSTESTKMLQSVEYVGGTIHAGYTTDFEAPALLDAGGIQTYDPYFVSGRGELENFYAPKLHTIRGPLLTDSRHIHLPSLRSCGPILNYAPYEHEVADTEHEFLAPKID